MGTYQLPSASPFRVFSSNSVLLCYFMHHDQTKRNTNRGFTHKKLRKFNRLFTSCMPTFWKWYREPSSHIGCYVVSHPGVRWSWIWHITHCLWLGHETMVCAVCLFIFLSSNGVLFRSKFNAGLWYILWRCDKSHHSGSPRRFDFVECLYFHL